MGQRLTLPRLRWPIVRRMLPALLSSVGLLASVVGADGATPLNARSPLGINVLSMSYYNAEQPFLNVFKTEAVSKSTPDGWITHSSAIWETHEEAYLQLDADGYPVSLLASAADPQRPQQFNSVGVLLLRGLGNSNAGRGPPYRPGKYIVLYDGQGTLAYGFDAKLITSSPGRDVIDVAHPSTGGGIDLRITSTDPRHTGNHIRNIRVVKAEEESLLGEGEVFRPGYLKVMQKFAVIRLMQWLGIDDRGGAIANWSDRSMPSDGGWGSEHGVPIEIAVQLCNAVSADCWLNVPHAANDDYIIRMASLVHTMLGAHQKLYIEFSNEVWNSGYAQYAYAAARGQALWPGSRVSDYDYNRNWFGMRTAQMCDLWKGIWESDASRLICVLGAQAANPYTATQSLECPLWRAPHGAPCAHHNINAVAIAPYFGGGVPAIWASQSDRGLASLFAAMSTRNDRAIPEGGWLGQISTFEAVYQRVLAHYRLPLIGYEGGQTLVGFPAAQDGSALVNLFTAANRDARMAAAYTAALNSWKTNGGQVWALFADVSPPGQYGEWGALEAFVDADLPLESAPPKWRAIQSFIARNPCWWPGCAGVSAGAADRPQTLH
jgi:hypothetical protein